MAARYAPQPEYADRPAPDGDVHEGAAAVAGVDDAGEGPAAEDHAQDVHVEVVAEGIGGLGSQRPDGFEDPGVVHPEVDRTELVGHLSGESVEGVGRSHVDGLAHEVAPRWRARFVTCAEADRDMQRAARRSTIPAPSPRLAPVTTATRGDGADGVVRVTGSCPNGPSRTRRAPNIG